LGGADKQGCPCFRHITAEPPDLGAALRKYPVHVCGWLEHMDRVRVAVWRLNQGLPTGSERLPVHGVEDTVDERDRFIIREFPG
jgi:hypothetical protein